MEIIAALSALLGSSAIGTVIGGVFALFHKKQDASIEAAKQALELRMRDKDIELAKIEASSAQDVRVLEADNARFDSIGRIEDASALTEGVLRAAGRWAWMFIVADAIRRLIRPAATIVLLGTSVWLVAYLLVGLDSLSLLGTEERYQLVMNSITWVFGQASAVISFWFVSRGTSK